MPRYEGMEDLLQRVRQRLGVIDPDAEADENVPSVEHNQHNVATREALLLLTRDAEKLHELLDPVQLQRLTEEQRDELTAMLGNVLRELWRSKAAFERLKSPS